jgi:hypothetical protein
MLNANWTATAGGLLLAVGLAAGCSQNAANEAASTDKGGHSDDAHPTEGPHGGSLIELGNEEYHAELIHDENSGKVTVYLLDASATASAPIEATELTINLKHDGAAEQFKVAAEPADTDPQGRSSRFTSDNAELGEDLEHEDAEPQLVATIDGKQYRGAIEHSHEHEDHGH